MDQEAGLRSVYTLEMSYWTFTLYAPGVGTQVCTLGMTGCKWHAPLGTSFSRSESQSNIKGKKYQTNPNWAVFYKIPTSTPQIFQGHQKQGKCKKWLQDKWAEDMIIKCDAVFWMGLYYRKRRGIVQNPEKYK